MSTWIMELHMRVTQFRWLHLILTLCTLFSHFVLCYTNTYIFILITGVFIFFIILLCDVGTSRTLHM